LFFFLLSCELTRQERFFIHAKCPLLSSCTYSKLTCFSLFVSVKMYRKNREFFLLLDVVYIDGDIVEIFKLFNLIKCHRKHNVFEIQHCISGYEVFRSDFFSAGCRVTTTDYAKHALSIDCTLITALFIIISRVYI